jgi:hypothetical protein
MIIIGVDPGVSGGIAWGNIKTGEYNSFKMPETQHDIFDVFKDIKLYHPMVKAYIEEVSCRPGEGVKSVWTFSGNFHSIKMALVALEIPFTLVRPQVWQKKLSVSKSGVPKLNKNATIGEKTAHQKLKYKAKKEHKNKLKSKAQQLFPKQKVTLYTADALLLVEYGRINNVGI